MNDKIKVALHESADSDKVLKWIPITGDLRELHDNGDLHGVYEQYRPHRNRVVAEDRWGKLHEVYQTETGEWDLAQ